MKLMYLATQGRAVEMLKIKSKLYKKRSLQKSLWSKLWQV